MAQNSHDAVLALLPMLISIIYVATIFVAPYSSSDEHHVYIIISV
jgi:hypothetical protein